MRAPSHKLQQHVIIPIALLVVLAMAVVVGFVWYSARTQDRIALEKSIEAVRTAVTRKHAQLGATATDYGWWNDAVEHLDLSLDEGWADDNIGLYQYETYGIELSLVVDRRDQAIFTRLDGEPAAIDAFRALPGLEDLVADARAAAGEEIHAAAGVLPFRDGLAFVAASVVTPYDAGRMQVPEGRIVLIFAKSITQEMLQGLPVRQADAGERVRAAL